MSLESLKPFLEPRSIAMIGASENPNKIGGRPIAYLQRYGFKGKVYPINPTRKELQGQVCYPSLADLPEVPELVVVAVPGDNAIAAVKDCAARGVKAVILMSSGFGETAAPEGKAKEREMVEAARAAGMRMVGPNTQGLANFGNGAVTSFSTLFTAVPQMDGPIAMVSQSGAMSAVPVGLLRQLGLGVRYSLATGNDADVTVAEMAAAAVSDPAIKLLLLYLESIPRPDQLAEVARIAHARGAYVVALKSGRTDAGQRAARSHTGALANEDRVVDAALERLGIWRARDVAGLVSAADLYLKGWKPKGRRLVAISGSGATCVMAADAATFAGLEIATLKPETRASLNALLPSFATTTNPIDLTAALLSNNRLLSDILPIIARDDAADAFMIGFPVAGEGYDVPAFARDTASFAKDTGKPVVVAASQPDIAAQFRAEGVPSLPLEAEAIAALAQFIRHNELIARIKQRPWPQWTLPAKTPGGEKVLNEAESLAVLARAGLSVVPHHLSRSEAEAATAWRNFGGPVAIKGCTGDITHKTEYGLVQLNLDDEDAIKEGYRRIEKTLSAHQARFDGVIVARMVKGRREMMIGAHRDPIFGPVVVVGEGGKYVEAMPDLKLLLPPFDVEDAMRALLSLRCATVLRGVRGEPPMDVRAMAQAAVQIAELMRDPAIQSLDVNPLMLGSDGEGYAIVDAVVIRGAGS
ncbi:MAG: acetate--CoA ligase family protein [Hyphomicrobiaceae bacterium]